uniref:Uncharacterized protein n=1 Tax=Octopus bimaculoides TaxID=37653 RepID=A0A0L8I1Q7_OCTBM
MTWRRPLMGFYTMKSGGVLRELWPDEEHVGTIQTTYRGVVIKVRTNNEFRNELYMQVDHQGSVSTPNSLPFTLVLQTKADKFNADYPQKLMDADNLGLTAQFVELTFNTLMVNHVAVQVFSLVTADTLCHLQRGRKLVQQEDSASSCESLKKFHVWTQIKKSK